eukprot:CAMPEP_0170200174 /NCGR_PEP_ID=MMETSP0040_2-20121228/69735_1 /TAXON_ID=641309 /ORGANISM="Lotharella oceanica, Strain CCMP622" /LENGTH=104 /DNA_ID=CAMNT_0010450351 /DNA_START=752 /DNA_END=1067 /DNA_ORIENTATION=-
MYRKLVLQTPPPPRQRAEHQTPPEGATALTLAFVASYPLDVPPSKDHSSHRSSCAREEELQANGCGVAPQLDLQVICGPKLDACDDEIECRERENDGHVRHVRD